MLEEWGYAAKDLAPAAILIIQVHEQVEDFLDLFKEDTTLADAIHQEIRTMDVEYMYVDIMLFQFCLHFPLSFISQAFSSSRMGG